MKKMIALFAFMTIAFSSCGVVEIIDADGNKTSVTESASDSEKTEENKESEAETTEGNEISAETTESADENTEPETEVSEETEINSETDYEVTTTESTYENNTDSSEMTAVIKNLTDKNLDCMYHIYGLSMLPCDESVPIEYDNPETYLAKCTSEKFRTYNDLAEYTYSVYTDSLAYELLNYEVQSQKRYVDVDGELYCNRYCNGGKGYYVDWENYSVSIDELADDYCIFTLYATVTWPAENPVAEDYTVAGKAVLEDGEWVLTAMLS